MRKMIDGLRKDIRDLSGVKDGPKDGPPMGDRRGVGMRPMGPGGFPGGFPGRPGDGPGGRRFGPDKD